MRAAITTHNVGGFVVIVCPANALPLSGMFEREAAYTFACIGFGGYPQPATRATTR